MTASYTILVWLGQIDIDQQKNPEP